MVRARMVLVITTLTCQKTYLMLIGSLKIPY